MDEVPAVVAEAAVDPVAEPTPEELKKQVEDLTAEKAAAVAQRDATVAQLATVEQEATKQAEQFALDREALRDEAATFKATAEAAFEADAERHRAAFTDAISATETRLGAAVSALTLERDEAVNALNNRVAEAVDEYLKAIVDELFLPWDGPGAIRKQMREIRAQLDKAQGAKSTPVGVSEFQSP